MTQCHYCGEPAETIDHVIPKSRGGTDEPGNLVPACRRCNASKGTKLLSEWRGPNPAGKSWRMDRILTIPEVADYLKISRSKVYALVARNQIPYIRIGRNVRIKESDLERWINQQAHGGQDDVSQNWR